MIYRQGILSTLTKPMGDNTNSTIYTVPAEVDYADVKIHIRGGTQNVLAYNSGSTKNWIRNEVTGRTTPNTQDHSYPSDTMRVPSGGNLVIQPIGTWGSAMDISVVGVEYQKINGSKYRFTRVGRAVGVQTSGGINFETVYTCPSDVQYAVVNPRAVVIDNNDNNRVQVIRADGHIVAFGGCVAYRLINAQVPFMETSFIMVPGDRLQFLVRRSTTTGYTAYSGIDADIHEYLK